MNVIIKGRVTTGDGKAAGFTGLDWVRDQLLDHFGIDPHPGTLNVLADTEAVKEQWAALQARGGQPLLPADGACAAMCFPVVVENRLPAVIVQPRVPAYPEDKIEVLAATSVRGAFALADGDPITLSPWRLPPLEGVIFDVDGTLVDTLDAFHIVAERAAAPYGIAVPREAVRRALNDQSSFWDRVVAAERDDRDLIKAELHQAATALWPEVLAAHAHLVPGAAEILGALREAGLRLGLVTGARRGSFEPLQEAGLMDCFDAVVTGEDVVRGKPHPEGIRQCLAALDLRPGHAAYVGDTPVDMAASRAAGVVPLAVLTGAGDSKLLTLAGAARISSSLARLRHLLLHSSEGHSGVRGGAGGRASDGPD